MLSLTPLLCLAQSGIQSVSCNPGNTSCSIYKFSYYAGYITCSCSAQCTNGTNINAAYFVDWACSDPHTGNVRGGALNFGVKVDGDLLNVATNLYAGQGYSAMDCIGNRSGVDFAGPC